MTHPAGDTYVFEFRAVQDKAPSASGVYTIQSSRRWLFVGESADIRQSLFQHLNAPGPCIAHQRGPLSFSYELASPVERASRQRTLASALAPTCSGTLAP